MEQENKVILLGNLGSSRLLDVPDEYFLRRFSEILPRGRTDIVDACVANHLSMSNLRANIKSCLSLMTEQKVVQQYAFKLFRFFQGIGFVGITKVNLRNAP